MLKTMLPVWQNWERLGKHVRATSVSGNMFPTMGNNNNNNLYSCPEMFTIDKYIQGEKLTIKEMSTAT